MAKKQTKKTSGKRGIKTRQNSWAARSEAMQSGGVRCWFCEHEILPDYKDVQVLRVFLSPRGKILSRQITFTCAKHQRIMAKEAKIARHMALLR